MRTFILVIILSLSAAAQVYSPKVLRKGQPDSSDLHKLAQGIYAQAGARTPRERAEAVWRFFLTDGRFVHPGFWYHIAGWAYEEPEGEVLDPLKLLNSYGFGLCYHIAPVLEAVWKAGGFEDARVWFLTGHTVAEVFYEGAYHYFDSDMLGYNTIGRGDVKKLPVASVHQIELDGNIMLSKLISPKEVNRTLVDDPWYPADVREGAIGGLAELFTTAGDNHLFPFERAPQGHSMDFVLRPGERLVRYFEPEDGSYYLPYKFNGRTWQEFPQEIAAYRIRTEDGPRSQKDSRLWATGRIEYRPPLTSAADSTFDVRCPYVIIDAEFQIDAVLASRQDTLTLDTSTDDGRTWISAGKILGPYRGTWKTEPAILTRSEHGRRTAVSGSYGYFLRVHKSGAELRGFFLRTRIQLNPRTLPELGAGRNEIEYSSGPSLIRCAVAPEPILLNARYVTESGQTYWAPAADGPADLLFRVAAHDRVPLAGFHAGGRFLDLSSGLAPDKFTAEVRTVNRISARKPAASIAWSTSDSGPFHTIWEYDPHLKWKDGNPIDRCLRWLEVDRSADLPGVESVYIRFRIQDLALDSVRLAYASKSAGGSPLEVTHIWKENGIRRSTSRTIPQGTVQFRYRIDTPRGAKIINQAIIVEAR